MTPERPIASVSLDADNLWSYLRAHGDSRWQARPSYLPALARRMHEVFNAHRLTPSVFVVGADAAGPDGPDFVCAMTERGCEIGNHSFEHEPWLHLYSGEQLRGGRGPAGPARPTRTVATTGPRHAANHRRSTVGKRL